MNPNEKKTELARHWLTNNKLKKKLTELGWHRQINNESEQHWPPVSSWIVNFGVPVVKATPKQPIDVTRAQWV